MLPIEESGKRKFKVIRRRPTSTTEAGDSSHNVLLTSTTVAPRKRIIIRKKIRPTENEPEIVAKSVGFVKAAQKDITTEAIVNYGEKTRPTILVSSVTQSSHDEEDNEDDIVPEILRVETDNDSDSNKENSDEEPVNKNIVKESESHSGNREEEVKSDSSSKETQPATVSNTESQREITKEEDTTEIKEHTDSETDRKPEVIIEDEQKSVVISETETTPTLPTSVTEESQPETTTSTTTPAPPSSSRTRLPYRPSRKLFTSSTEPPVPSSSRTFSRKYNPGAYTSPATIERESFRPSTTRRPLFTPRTTSRTRRPYTTARTTPKVEDEEEEYPDEEVLDEEPENSLVFVPAGQLFSRNPSQKEEESEEEYNSEEEETKEESLSNRFTSTSIKPGFKPRVVNSNTFRSSSTTEPTKKSVNSSQNRTAVYTRFGPNKPVDTTKRVQNVPVGYNSPVSTTSKTKLSVETKQTSTTAKEELSTTVSNVGTEITTVDDDYLSITEPSNLTTENANDATATNSVENETTTNFATNADTDDYLEFTTYYPTTQVGSTNTESESDNQIIYARGPVNTEANIEITTEILTDTTTTTTTQTPPVIKTQFDKLFSVSRSVEVNSKLDKHRLNKNNETTLIEEGKIMVEKKPVVNKIGEVSRFSFIKIVEDEIPIYLTKLGHIYPVEHLPDNNIRIDEARNARALQNFADAPRENLLASESINEAYRHIKKPNENSEIKDRIEHVPGDDFLSYVNDDKKTDKLEDAPFPSEWQFVPAAFEKENSDNKGAKNFEIITPHTLLTNPSTLPLESLFKTENPIMEQISDEKQNQPFVVYSSSLPNQKEEGNIVKLQVIKPETGRSIITFAKGQEFAGAPVNEDTTVKYPVSISVLPKSSDAISSTVNIVSTTTTERATSPVIQLLTTAQTTTLSTEPPTTITTEPTTTETVPEETTTLKLSPLDAKRSKIFPRRPIIKPFNATRPIPRANNKINATVSPNLSQKANKTTGFSPSKSRFNGNRAQNVPVDSRIKAVTKTTVKPRTFTTETSRSTTERRLFIKPIRPGFRPSFVPRKSITTTPASDT
ncbi:mucin-2-like [Plodia interpunctella]|uniref:mucin-2-like n=1 Tax=Plodia interpunctella TaxID=58824 RepID=UPI003101AB5D